jgi:hypothetical protein
MDTNDEHTLFQQATSMTSYIVLAHVTPVFSGVHVTRTLVVCAYFVDHCLFFCPFSFDYCVVCSSIYRF